MSDPQHGPSPLLPLLATGGCVIIGLVSIVSEVVCRLSHIDTPLSFSTLTGVAIGALAGAVPGSQSNGKIPPKSP